MKLRYYIISLLALLAFATSCEEDAPTLLKEVQLSSSYVAIPIEGGSTSITVNATDAWTITEVPAWLSVSPTEGAAGEGIITFKADKASATNEATIKLACAGKTQYINIIQLAEKTEVTPSTCAEVIAGPDSKTYRVTGTCTSIANTQYGNWYLDDGTGSIYIYGTVDEAGSYNWNKFGIEVGDKVTVEGPKTTYNGTVELVDVSVVSVVKSLIKVEEQPAEIGKEGGEAFAKITYKGNGYSFSIPENDKSWLSISGTQVVGDTTVVTFYAQPNEGGARTTTVSFSSAKGSQNSTVTATVNQAGAIAEVSIAEFNAAEVGTAQYKITGVITSVAKAAYGNVYLKDYSGETYVYGIGAKGDFEALGLKEGDIVTVIGTRGQYGETIEMMGGQYVSHIPVTTVTVADFNAQADGTEWYRLSGSVRAANDDELAAGCKNDMQTYGNFILEDESGSVYVYGLTTGYNGVSKQFGTLGVDYGDYVTIIAQKSTYKGLIEANKAMYVSHENKPE